MYPPPPARTADASHSLCRYSSFLLHPPSLPYAAGVARKATDDMRLPVGLELDMDRKVGLRLLRRRTNKVSLRVHARMRSEQRTALAHVFSSLLLQRFWNDAERQSGWLAGVVLTLRSLLPFALRILPGKVPP